MTEVKRCVGSSNYVKLANISTDLQNSVLVSEDQKFFNHPGIDFKSIKQSLESNLKEGRIVRGGSTISQQLIKNLYLSTDKTYARKFRELIYTLELERRFSKKKILELYLNVAEFGPRVYGIKRASQFYFQKGPKDLTLFESLFLAHVLPSPYYYSKNFLNNTLSEFNKEHMLAINDWMLKFKFVTEEDYDLAKYEINNW